MFETAAVLRESGGEDPARRWLADFLLEGEPKPVSNFKLEIVALLRNERGDVQRLVRLVNTMGEVSKGQFMGGAHLLPSEMYAGAEKFRQWCGSLGSFNWGYFTGGCSGGGAGTIELQMLQADVTNDAVDRVANLVEYCG